MLFINYILEVRNMPTIVTNILEVRNMPTIVTNVNQQ